MSAAVDMPIQHRDGRRGRLIAVRSEPQGISASTTPGAWAILVVVGGRFEEWRAVDCQTAPPVAAPRPPPTGYVSDDGVYHPPPTRASAGPYCTCSNGCKRPECDRV